jgi:hypothetical protein
MIHSAASSRTSGRIFGFPLEGFGLFTSLLLAAATGFFVFFATTFFAIVWLLVWNGILGHNVNYADTYLYVGLPSGLLALILALIVFGGLWIRAKFR